MHVLVFEKELNIQNVLKSQLVFIAEVNTPYTIIHKLVVKF